MTMLLPPFELHKPETVEEAVALLDKFGPDQADLVAGGSDLLCNYKWGLNTKPHLISLGQVTSLKSIKPDRIGACVTLREIAESEIVQGNYPALASTANKVASVLIQEQATLGGNLLLDTRCHFFNQSYLWRRSLGYCLKADGNLCHVVPKIKKDGEFVENSFECFATNSSDMLPLVIVLDGVLEFASSAGTRKVPAKDFFRHDGIARFDLKEGEILTGVSFPAESKSLTMGYKKLRPRESWDFPVLGVAAAISKASDGKLERFRLCVNAVDTHPTSFDDLCGQYIGKELSEEAAADIAEQVQSSVQPKLNVPMEPGYRKKMAGVFTRRLLNELAQNGSH